MAFTVGCDHTAPSVCCARLEPNAKK